MGHNSFVYLDDGFCSKPERTSAVAARLFSEDSSGLLVEKKKPPWVPMTDSVLSRIWYILSLNWHSLSVTFSLGVSVSTLREEFKKHIKTFVSDISKYGIHSIKSGAASNPACRKIAGDLLDIHADWRCESTKHRYIKHGLSERLAVSTELSI